MSLVGLYTSLSGIQAARVGMDVTAHNVANANTPGYTRQRVDLAARYPNQTSVGKIGSGVTVTDIARVRDAFMDARVRSDLAAGGELDVRADLLGRTEAIFGEPDNGLSAELNEIWAAFEELSLRPDDQATRRQVVSALDSFTSRVQSIAGGLDTLEQDTTLRLQQGVAEVNELLERVADLNGSILDSQTGPGVPNDLLDERDLLLDQLTQQAGARVSVADDGTARVSIAGMSVVSGTNHQPLAVYDEDTHGTAGVAFDIMHPNGTSVDVGGELAGLQSFLQEDLSYWVGQLDGFLTEVTEQLNGQHASGYSFDDTGTATAGTEVFSYVGGVSRAGAIQTAFTLKLTDPQAIAASSDPEAPLDGSNAGALAGLRTAPYDSDPTDDTPSTNSLIDGEIRRIVTDLAAQVQAADRQASGQGDLTAAAQAARQGMHGVSIDEELVSMLSHQRALEASARVMSAVDQALDVLINRTGVVGR